MRYAAEMDIGAITYLPSFIKTDSGIYKLMGGNSYTQTAWKLHKPSLGK
jgi:hypothetical protein